MTTMDELIEDILTECQDVETRVPWPQRPFTDLDSQAHSPVRLPAEEGWVDILNDAKDEFEVDGATVVFSTWRVEAEDPLDIGDIEIGDGMYARAGQLALDACMTDQRAAQILAGLPEDDEHLLRIKFLRERNGDWVVSMKTSLTQSGQSGRKARGSSRCRGTQKQGF